MEHKEKNIKQELIDFYSRLLRYYETLASSPENSIQHRMLLRATEYQMADVYQKINQAADNCILSPGKAIIASLRRRYPVGCRVVLDEMDDPQAPPVGTIGTVVGVDDIGSVLVNWDAGGSLHLAYGADKFHRLYTVKQCDGKNVDLQTLYPSGSRIMIDHAVNSDIPAGAKGTVQTIDGAGAVLVRCDGGKQVRLLPGEHRFHRIWDTELNVVKLTRELLSFCEDNHYRQSPTIIGLWQPGAISEQTQEQLCFLSSLEKVILGIRRFRDHGYLPQKELARADKLLQDLYARYIGISMLPADAIMRINEFVSTKYQEKNGADFSDLFSIPVAYTEKDGVEIQVYVNLIEHRIDTYVDEVLVETVQRDTLIELFIQDLMMLDFDALVELPDNEEAT